MIGLAPFGVSQKKDPAPQPGPPFTSNSANNGLSVDSVSGKIVLGNDQGDILMPAQLLSAREIVDNAAFPIRIVDFVPALFVNKIRSERINIEEQLNLGFVDMHLTPAGGAQINAQSNTAGQDSVIGASSLTSAVVLQTNGAQPFLNFLNPTTDFSAILVLGVLRIRSVSGTGNGLNIDSGANDVNSTGTISTADPGSGVGKIKTGSVVAGAVALDPNNYWEVEINGVVKKVGLVV